ncbi:MAG: hypothetical protein AABX16_04790 [Nanoarchaeota archaeon]
MKINIHKLIENKDYCEKIFNFFIKNQSLRKTDSSLFEKHLNKSLSNLEFANFILSEHAYSIKEKLPNKKFYDWSIVVYYYSLYHAVLALIIKAGFESKNHIASICVLTLFCHHKNNLLKKDDIEFIIDNFNLKSEDIEFLFNSKELREKATYRVDEYFDLYIAQSLQKKTADFVNKVKNILEE